MLAKTDPVVNKKSDDANKKEPESDSYRHLIKQPFDMSLVQRILHKNTLCFFFFFENLLKAVFLMVNASQLDKILPKGEGAGGKRWSKLSALQKKGFKSLTAKQRSSFYAFYF